MGCVKDSPPSQLPLATTLTVPGFLQSTSTASMWPSKLATKGFANILSILAAFRARVRSRARAKGWSKGSRLREVGVGSPGLVGRCADGACWRTEIFWAGRNYRHDWGAQGHTIACRKYAAGGNLKMTAFSRPAKASSSVIPPSHNMALKQRTIHSKLHSASPERQAAYQKGAGEP